MFEKLNEYPKGQQFYYLILKLQSYNGLSYSQIQDLFNCERRTAERKIGEVRDLNVGLESFIDDDGYKRWRIPTATLNPFIMPTSDELSSLSIAINKLQADGLNDVVTGLTDLESKIYALIPPRDARRIAPDLEVLTETEGIARRVGPYTAVDRTLIAELREAIIGCTELNITYLDRTTRHFRGKWFEPKKLKIQPLGLVYANRSYLIANIIEAEYYAGGRSTLAIDFITECEVTGTSFDDNGFSLDAYLEDRFGVHGSGELRSVILKFDGTVADYARNFIFHQSQTVEDGPKGTVFIKFKCKVSHELLWTLFTFGHSVTIVEPMDIKDKYFARLSSLARGIGNEIAEEWSSKPTLNLGLTADEERTFKKMISLDEPSYMNVEDLNEAKRIKTEYDLSKIPRKSIFSIEAIIDDYISTREEAGLKVSKKQKLVINKLESLPDVNRSWRHIKHALH